MFSRGDNRGEKTRIGRISLIILFNLFILISLFLSAEYIYRRFVLSHSVFEDEPFFEYDEKLGWIPKPGSYETVAGSVTITPQRFRKTRPPNVHLSEKKILVCGDSFTFCNFTADDETWPYYLSEKLNCRVINAGVSGYGFDQLVLRMSEVIDDINPDLVVLSLVYDDIPRCELSKRIHYKPYYKIVDDEIVLLNQPVPLPTEVTESQRWYDNFLIIRDLKDLFQDNDNPHRHDIVAHREGMAVARHLCALAKKIVHKKGAELLILIQPNQISPYPDEVRGANELEAIAGSFKIAVLNLFPIWQEKFRKKDEEVLFGPDTGHLSARGNDWVAEKLAAYIINKKMLQ